MFLEAGPYFFGTRLMRFKPSVRQHFLDLSDVEATLIDVRLALAIELRARRRARKISQAVLARRVGSSQSRVAKMEAADRSVSIDLLIRCLLALGSTRRDIGRAIAEAGSGAATRASGAAHHRHTAR